MNFRFNVKFSALNFLLFWNFLTFGLVVLLQMLLGVRGFTSNDFSLIGGISFEGSIVNVYTLVTSNFLHIDPIHFVANMFSLYRIGQIVESYYGERKTFATYILGGIGGMAFSVMVYAFRDQSFYTLGASASIFALLGLLLGGSVKKYRFGHSLPFNVSDLIPSIFLTLSMGFIPGLNVNNYAHIGGLIAGFLLGLVYKNNMNVYHNKSDKLLTNLSYVASVGLFSLAYLMLLTNWGFQFLD